MANPPSFPGNSLGIVQNGTTGPTMNTRPGTVKGSHTFSRTDLACMVFPDETLMAVARFARMQSGGLAEKFLDHFLAGSGMPVFVDIGRLWAEDSGVQQTIRNAVAAALLRTPPVMSGTVPLPQSKFTNHDWVFALGSINMDWSIPLGFTPSVTPPKPPAGAVVHTEVELRFTNEYRWHPEDGRRDTQCLHAAAVRLKEKIGAKDFLMIGRATMVFI